MLAHTAYQELTCSGCGGYLPETTEQDADGGYQVDLPIRCHRCTAISVAAKPYEKSEHGHALRFPARRR